MENRINLNVDEENINIHIDETPAFTVEINPVEDVVIELNEQGPAGPRGHRGETGNGIASFELTSSSGLTDTYTITFTDGNTQSIDIENGRDAVISGVSATVNNTVGVPTVNVITEGTPYDRSFTFEFENLKGEQGPQGEIGPQGIPGPQGPEGGTRSGVKGDYCTTYGIEYCQYGLIINPAGTKNITVKGGMMLCIPGAETKTTIGSDINYTVKSDSDITIFYVDGNLLEASKVYFSITEPTETTNGYIAWWNPDYGKWRFKSNDTGNVWREGNATPLADVRIDEGVITRIDYVGYRILNDDIYAIKSDVDFSILNINENIEELDNRIDNIGNEYANNDLSNLTSIGEKHFLNKSQITNCILEVPQNIKLELDNGTLTLKKGSKVIVPNGVRKFEEYVTPSDLVINPAGTTANDVRMIFITTNPFGLAFRHAPGECHSGATAPTNVTTTACWYDTANNIIKLTKDKGSTWTSDTKYALPLGIYTRKNGVGVSSLDQVFNGMGYIGSTVWVDKGVKGLIPNGRNADGTLNNIEWITDKIYKREMTWASTNFCVALTPTASYQIHYFTKYFESDVQPTNATNGNMWLNALENRQYRYVDGVWQDESSYTDNLFFAYITTNANKQITSLQPKLPFRAVDYNDLDNYVKGMPVGTVFSHTCSASFVPENSLPCNGSEYTQAQFPNLYNEWLVGGKLKTCTYTEYSNMLTTYGQCPMWALDTTNKKFRVPIIKDGAVVQQAMSNSELGKAYNAGLPNITGTCQNDNNQGSWITGAFYNAGGSGNGAKGGGTDSILGFDASLSNPIYGNSNTVQMNAVALRYFVVVATKAISQSAMNWSAWAGGLANKANVDLSNAEPSQSFIDKSIGWGMPDMSNGISIANGSASAPSKFPYPVMFFSTQANWGADSILYISEEPNSNTYISLQMGYANNAQRQSFSWLIGANHNFYVTNSSESRVYPLKGGNY